MGIYVVLFHCSIKCHQSSNNLNPFNSVQRTWTLQLFLSFLASLSLLHCEFTEVCGNSGRYKVSSFCQSWVWQERTISSSPLPSTLWDLRLALLTQEGSMTQYLMLTCIYILNPFPQHFSLPASFIIWLYSCFRWHTTTRQPNVIGNQHQNSTKYAKEPRVLQCLGS